MIGCISRVETSSLASRLLQIREQLAANQQPLEIPNLMDQKFQCIVST